MKVDCATLLELTNIVELVLEVEEGVVEEDEADEDNTADQEEDDIVIEELGSELSEEAYDYDSDSEPEQTK